MAGKEHSGNSELVMLANNILENTVRINNLRAGRSVLGKSVPEV